LGFSRRKLDDLIPSSLHDGVDKTKLVGEGMILVELTLPIFVALDYPGHEMPPSDLPDAT
jgi:hypothetical protein